MFGFVAVSAKFVVCFCCCRYCSCDRCLPCSFLMRVFFSLSCCVYLAAASVSFSSLFLLGSSDRWWFLLFWLPFISFMLTDGLLFVLYSNMYKYLVMQTHTLQTTCKTDNSSAHNETESRPAHLAGFFYWTISFPLPLSLSMYVCMSPMCLHLIAGI